MDSRLLSPLLPLLTLAWLGFATTVDAKPTYHTVSKGDTLHRIAKNKNTTVQELKTANGLKSDLIRLGQRLVIPVQTAHSPVNNTPKKSPDSSEVPTAIPVAEVTTVKPAPTPASTADPLTALSATDRLRVLIYLDHLGFAPGKIDGMLGEFSGKALARWLRANPKSSSAKLLTLARAEVSHVTMETKVPDLAKAFVGTLPKEVEEKSKLKMLPYASYAEFIAERYRTDEPMLARLNPGLDLKTIVPGTTLNVPAVRAFQIEQWSGTTPTAGKRKDTLIRIQHMDRMIEVWKTDGTLIATFPITVGSKPEYVRKGLWRIANFAPNPDFLWDEDLLKKGVQGTKRYNLPAGPNNPVGVLWLGLSQVSGTGARIGIHGTDNPTRIGRNHSSGCVRLANWDVVRLAKLVSVGTYVIWEEGTQPPVFPTESMASLSR